jgi:hypothetical protein
MVRIAVYNLTTCDVGAVKAAESPYWVETIIPGGTTEVRHLVVPELILSKVRYRRHSERAGGDRRDGCNQYCDGFGRIQCSMFCVSYKSDDRQDFVPCRAGMMDYCPIGFRAPERKL